MLSATCFTRTSIVNLYVVGFFMVEELCVDANRVSSTFYDKSFLWKTWK